MRWGFGWELGPFELIDAIGIPAVLEAAGQAPRPGAPNDGDGDAGRPSTGRDAPPLLREALSTGRTTFRTGPLPPAGPGLEILRSARDASTVVRSNAGASLAPQKLSSAW